MKPLIPLEFSKFFAWNERNQYEKFGYPGVYAICMTESMIAGHGFSWDEVIYIGMTTKSLRYRLSRFDRAIRGKGGHSGGDTLYEEMQAKIDSSQLYVAMMGLECDVDKRLPDDLRVLGNVVYLEYEAFAQFYIATGQAKPQINKQ